MKHQPHPIANIAVATLIISNIIPIFGVLSWGWDLFQLMLLYLGELVILGLFSYLKIAKVQQVWWSEESKYVVGISTLATGIYFIFLCLIFSGLFDPTQEEIDTATLIALGSKISQVATIIAWPLLTIAISHSLSYFLNFLGRQEYLRLTPDQLTQNLGWRMIGLHLAILGGAYWATQEHNPALPAILILMGIKTLADFITHVEEHRRANKPHPIT